MTAHHPFSPSSNNNNNTTTTTTTISPRTSFRASASPAISSIIDPPEPSLPYSRAPAVDRPVPAPSPIHASPHTTQPPSQPQPQQQPAPMEIDTDKTVKPSREKKGTGTSTGPPSNAPSPKPARTTTTTTTKEAPPPLPQGSGLISGALFGVDGAAGASGAKSAPNIILHIPLKGVSNKIINFARMAEEQYGFAALHPRLAAQRERLARVAAASAALEKNARGGGESAEEDLSVDVDRDSDLDGDVPMGGMGTTTTTATNGAVSDTGLGTTAENGKKKRTRKKKIEDYDRDDPFVDDSELAWQEHAAASKDGFFVYSGPLVPEGEKVQVERFVLFFPSFCRIRHG